MPETSKAPRIVGLLFEGFEMPLAMGRAYPTLTTGENPVEGGGSSNGKQPAPASTAGCNGLARGVAGTDTTRSPSNKPSLASSCAATSPTSASPAMACGCRSSGSGQEAVVKMAESAFPKCPHALGAVPTPPTALPTPTRQGRALHLCSETVTPRNRVR